MNKTHSNKQPNPTPEDDQRNGRKVWGTFFIILTQT